MMTAKEEILRCSLLHEQAAELIRQDADRHEARAKELRAEADRIEDE